MERLAAENPNDGIEVPVRPDGAEFEPWHDLYLSAFQALMHDRNYTGMGVAMPISYLSISRYAADHNIPKSELDVFVGLVRRLDEEWLKVLEKKQERMAKIDS